MKKHQHSGRDVNGILLLDKSVGLTSNAALQSVKRLLKARKAGHTGSLDPLASGMLPICFGEATKFSQFLLEADKTYYVTAKLGVVTNTGDADGEIIKQTAVTDITQQQIETALQSFVGDIEQIPSMFSAIKHNGQPLYKLARQGVNVERAARTITIYELELIDYTVNDSFQFKVRCSKGTYVRTLVEDVGELLSVGAHVSQLRRTTVGPYQEQQMLSMEVLEKSVEEYGISFFDDKLLAVDSAMADCTIVDISDAAAFYLRQGQPIIVPHAPTEGIVRLYIKGEQFLGVGEVLSDGRIAPRRLTKIHQKVKPVKNTV